MLCRNRSVAHVENELANIPSFYCSSRHVCIAPMCVDEVPGSNGYSTEACTYPEFAVPIRSAILGRTLQSLIGGVVSLTASALSDDQTPTACYIQGAQYRRTDQQRLSSLEQGAAAMVRVSLMRPLMVSLTLDTSRIHSAPTFWAAIAPTVYSSFGGSNAEANK